jgi:hypothetical protein
MKPVTKKRKNIFDVVVNYGREEFWKDFKCPFFTKKYGFTLGSLVRLKTLLKTCSVGQIKLIILFKEHIIQKNHKSSLGKSSSLTRIML